MVIFLTTAFQVAEPTDRWEIAEVRWFALDELPEDLHEGTRHRIQEIAATVAQAG